MAEALFNAVAILDAIPSTELKTALRLKEALHDIASYEVQGLNVRYFRVDTRDDLAGAVATLSADADAIGLKPWLHIEGHGTSDESGFILGGGEFCSWTDLRTTVTPLNIATDFNLVLIMATCFGGSFARAMMTTDRAPVLGLIGPVREITAGEVEVDFTSFYTTFFQSGSFKEALQALNERSESGLYYLVNAEDFFYEVWARYKEHQCTDEMLDARARRIYRMAKAKALAELPSIGRIKRTLKQEEPRQFALFRDTFFMYDISDQYRIRFPVTYEEAESRVSRSG